MREKLFKVLGAILLVIILFTSCSKVDYLSDIDEAFGLAHELFVHLKSNKYPVKSLELRGMVK